MSIQWFPGHMAKTRKLMTDNLKLVDVAVEVLDARLPESSRNPLIHSLIGPKPRMLVLAKADLAEEAYNKAWVAAFRKQGLTAVACNFKSANPKEEIKKVTDGLRSRAEDILARRQSRGIANLTVRAMITGIPNAGKSTMINLLAGRATTETADRPGVTRGKQWIRLDRDLELLDMPGILWPNLEDKEGARKLAVTGAIGDNAYHQTELALWLIGWLREHRPGRLTMRYGVKESLSDDEIADFVSDGQIENAAAWPLMEAETEETAGEGGLSDTASWYILEAIGRRRGLLRKGGMVETDKAAIILLDELRGGKLGRITWDEPPADKEDGH
ncbi:MAG: ribosome biogenesis GTPase YlqF [Clostridiales bacterium]|nr:ribosome biogenesis GTPase YlqF [Clostridiales bacterium]